MLICIYNARNNYYYLPQHSNFSIGSEATDYTLYISGYSGTGGVIPCLTAIFQSSALMIKTITTILETVPVNTVVAGGIIAVLKESLLVNHMPPQLHTTTLSGLVLTAMQYMKQ